MVRPSYTAAELAAAIVWGALGVLLVASSVASSFDPIPALAEADGYWLGVVGMMLAGSMVVRVVSAGDVAETTRWRLWIWSDALRTLGLVGVAALAMIQPVPSIGWGIIGCGFSLVASLRMVALNRFARDVRRLRAEDRARKYA